jgi:DNA-directed RNA polymerase specialized sigma subunit
MREEKIMQDTKEIEHIFDELSTKNLQNRLIDIKGLLHSAQSEVEMLTKQRKVLVVLGFNSGLSIIKIGELLGITRQRVYRILDTTNEEE